MDALFINSGLKKLLHLSQVVIDNQIFRLHYKLSSLMLFAFSLAVSGYQFFGSPILCMNNDDIGNPSDGKSTRILNNFCWVEGTFTIPKYLTSKVGEEVPHPGVHKYLEGDEVIEHAYYQWVCFVLFMLGCLFYGPRLVWKSWEGHRIKSIISELYKPALEDKVGQEKKVVAYFLGHRGNHSGYAFKFLICEVLNFVNVIFQMCLLNKFLGGEFFTYGPRVFKFMRTDKGDTENPMIRVFPRVSKCIFHRIGPSGNVQKHDVMCALPLNILNEKVFAIIWVWFVFLAIVSGLAVLYRIIVYVSHRARILLTKTYNFLTPDDVIDDVLSQLSFGDWFVLYQVSCNVDNLHFRELMESLNTELKLRGPNDFTDGLRNSPSPDRADDSSV